jgi:hypothetical protein
MNNARNTASSPRGIAPRELAAGRVRGSGRRGAASRRSAICAAAAIASVGLAAAGCSAASEAAPASTAAAPGASATPAPATASAAPTSAATPPVPASASPADPVPTLGQPAGVFAHGQGFGQVRPPKIFNGGDPTGLVTHVVWRSWGGAQAVATGISDYVGPNQTVAGGRQERVTVVAFNLGTCDGTLMYRAVEWYFPQHGQAFDAGHYQDICTGTYVGSSP